MGGPILSRPPIPVLERSVTMPRRCSIDKKIATRDVATAYWSWYPETDQRVAYKLMYCVDHADILIRQIKDGSKYAVEMNLEDDGHCMRCGENVGPDVDLTWVSAYMPGVEELKVTLEHCFNCAPGFRAEIIDFGEKLPNRDGRRAGAPATSPWASLFGTTLDSKHV